MPVSPALAENLAADVVAMYAEAERILLQRIAKSLAKGIDAPNWVELKLLEVQYLRAQTQRLVADLGERAAAQVAVALAEAYSRGGASAAADLAALLKVSLAPASGQLAGLQAIERLVSQTMRSLIAANARMEIAVIEAFRAIITETAGQVLAGTLTRRQAAQAALDRFARRGITGFIDKRGRGWRMESYVEVAMRTGCGQAAVQGHVDRLQEYGEDLVMGSDAPKECPRCSPWEGRVMSISGRTPGYPTLAEARSAGWQHCNCRHAIVLWQEGVTRPMHNTEDPQGYKDAQRLRYLERQLRAAKRVEQVAMDGPAKALAAARVRTMQARIRDHVAETGAKRLRYREQIGKAI